MKRPFSLTLLAFSVLATPEAIAQVPPTWMTQAFHSIARIRSALCAGNCGGLAGGQEARVGTGFVWQPPWSNEPMMVTALHVIAGANLITYQYTETGDHALFQPAKIVADRAADIAFMSLDPSDSEGVPLQVGPGSAGAGGEVYVFGYKGALDHPTSSDQARVKVYAPTNLSAFLKDPKVVDQFETVGYPGLSLAVRGVDDLQPGDSGAPVFDRNGVVVGMAQGGIPQVASWMVPQEVLSAAVPDTDNVFQLRKLDTKVAYAANDLFFGRQSSGVNLTRNVGLYFEFQFLTARQPFVQYAKRARDEIGVKWKDLPQGRRGGYLLQPDDPAAPAKFAVPDFLNCSVDPDSDYCEDKRPQEQEIYNDLSRSGVELECYTVGHFQDVLRGSAPMVADLDLRMPLGNVEKGLAEAQFEMEAYPYRDQLWLRSNGILAFHPGQRGYFYRLNGVAMLDEMFGGACRIDLVEIGSEFDPGVAALQSALSAGAVCAQLNFDGATVPIALTAKLPDEDGVGGGKFWGMLPLGPRDVAFDDALCQ